MAWSAWRGVVVAASLSLLALGPTAASAQVPRDGTQACGGRDLLPELRARSAEVAQRFDTQATAMANAKAILWRLEKDGVPPSHLFGTVHVTDERVTNLTPTIQTAFDSSRVVALEIADLSPEALAQGMAKVQSLLQLPQDRSLDLMLTADEMGLARTELEKTGVPPPVASRLRPWVVSMSLALTDCEKGRKASGLKPLDEQLGLRARTRRIQVVGLESVELQMRAMAAIPEAEQVALLKAALKLHPINADMIETLIRRYLASDLAPIWQMQIELWREAGVSDAAMQSFQRELIGKRNVRMRDAALPYVSKGGTFIAVGALHLPGSDGLVALFEQAGFKAVPVE